jgi:cytochrome c-type biogenesis protein
LMPYLARISGELPTWGGYIGWYELRIYAGGATRRPNVSAAEDVQNQLVV